MIIRVDQNARPMQSSCIIVGFLENNIESSKAHIKILVSRSASAAPAFPLTIAKADMNNNKGIITPIIDPYNRSI